MLMAVFNTENYLSKQVFGCYGEKMWNADQVVLKGVVDKLKCIYKESNELRIHLKNLK